MKKWVAFLLALSLSSASFDAAASVVTSEGRRLVDTEGRNLMGHTVVGPVAAAIARTLLSDRRIHRGRRFFARRFELDLDDAIVIVGNRGERVVLIPLTDGVGEHEAYLVHARKGNKEKVMGFVLSLGRQAYTKRAEATRVKVSYFGSQEELDLVVEEAYIIYDYGEEVDFGNGEIVYTDGYGVVTSSELAAASLRSWVKCTVAGCSPCLACRYAGPLAIKCVLACCGGAAAGCALAELL